MILSRRLSSHGSLRTTPPARLAVVQWCSWPTRQSEPSRVETKALKDRQFKASLCAHRQPLYRWP